MLEMLFVLLYNDCKVIVDCVVKQDYVNFQEVVYKLYGVICYIGVLFLQDVLYILEEVLKLGIFELVNNLIEMLLKELDWVVMWCKEYWDMEVDLFVSEV